MTTVQVQTQIPDRDELSRLVPGNNFRLVKFFENMAKDVSTTIPDAIGQSIQGPGGAVDRDVVIFDGASGTSVKDSGISIDDVALLDSPAFTGTPTAPTAPPLTNTPQIATTAFVQAASAGFVTGPAVAVVGNVPVFNNVNGKVISDGSVALSALAPIASPTFTGVPAAPTASPGTNTTQIATTAFATAAVAAASTGRLLNVQTFTATGTYTPTSGTTRVLVKGQGAGGAGGGAPVCVAGQVSVGSGGGAGSIGETFLTSGFSGVTVTIGAGGTGVSGASGNSGGSTSFGALMTLAGGTGGGASSAQAVTAIGGVAGVVGSGGSVLNVNGAGTQTIAASFAQGYAQAGRGADSLYGSGGAGGFINSASNATGIGGLGRGAGGGGGAVFAGGGAVAGGAGTNGIVIIYEYS